MSAPDAITNKNTHYLKLLLGILILGIAVAAYQWVELLQIRTGGAAPLCTLSENIDCAAVWNSNLSSFVHETTGIPFAGWGLIWCLVCLGLLAMAWRRNQKQGEIVDQIFALRLVTGIGALISIALLGYSAYIRIFCPTCLLFYAIVGWAAYISFYSLVKRQVGDMFNASLLTVGWLAAFILMLIYPGLQTPKSATHDAVPVISETSGEKASPESISRFLTELEPDALQAVSDALYFYRNTPKINLAKDPKRITFGPRESAVHLTEWVDLRCSHCRNLHAALSQIKDMTPKNSWTQETRYFPLDGECNPQIKNSSGTGISCLAAKVLICLASNKKSNEIRTKLFESQPSLTVDGIWEIVAQHKQKANVQACVKSKQTQSSLQQDIDNAVLYNIEGTPLVVINGRQAPALPVFIYTLILAQGDDKNPAFNTLPTPNPNAFKSP